MKAIVSLGATGFSWKPYTMKTASVGEEHIYIYQLNPLWKPCFEWLCHRVEKRHSLVLADESIQGKLPHWSEPNTATIFARRFAQILACLPPANLIQPLLLCREDDPQLLPILKALSPYAKSVTVCTENEALFEHLSREALCQWGLTLTWKTPHTHSKTNSGVEIQVRQDGLCLFDRTAEPSAILWDVSNVSVTQFLTKYPNLKIKHCFLVPENEKIQNLIWKITKKS